MYTQHVGSKWREPAGVQCRVKRETSTRAVDPFQVRAQQFRRGVWFEINAWGCPDGVGGGHCSRLRLPRFDGSLTRCMRDVLVRWLDGCHDE